MDLGLSAIANYQGLLACLSTFQEDMATAWHSEEGIKISGLKGQGKRKALS
jgi:hypothetical protein